MVHPLYDLVARPLEQLAERVEQILDDDNRRPILGARMLRTLGDGSPRVLIKLALINDCLRVIEGVVGADATAARRRLLSAFPLLRAIAAYYARLREDYLPFARLTPDIAGRFIKYHYRDDKLFGSACERTRWLGRDICHRAAVLTQDRKLLESYERITGALLAHLLDSDPTRPVAPPPEPRPSDSAIRRYQGFDVEDADDHIELPSASPALAATEPELTTPLPIDGHYLRVDGEGFVLRHGRLQIEYQPAGTGPGFVRTDFVETPPSGDDWLSLPVERFEELQTRVLTELRHTVETGGSHVLPAIDPWGMSTEPTEQQAVIPLAPEEDWEESESAWEPEPPSAGGSGIRLHVEIGGLDPETAAIATDAPIPLASPVASEVPLALPIAVPAADDPPVVAMPPAALHVPMSPVTRLAWAAVEGLAEHIDSSLRDGVAVDTPCGEDHQTALMLASERGHLDVVRLLLDRGADANTTDDLGRTAWTLAAGAGHVAVAALLAERGAALQPDEALAEAVREGDVTAVDRLLNCGADPYRSFDGWSALTTAAALGREDVLLDLLARGVDPNQPDEHGRTAWVAARANGHVNAALLLEQRGATADVNAALLHAAHAGNQTAVRELLQAGADANTTGTLAGETIGCLEAALRGASASAADPFDEDAGPQWTHCLEALLDAGLDPDRATPSGRPLLMETVVYDRPEAAGLLIARGADLEVRDAEGATALIRAAAAGQLELVRTLLAAGAQADAREPRTGRTALLAVAATRVPRGRAIAAWLIAYGATVQARGRDGKSALDLAREAYRDADPDNSVATLLDDRDAVTRLTGSLVNPPQSARDHVRRGETYRVLGDPAAAAADFEEAIRLEPAKSSTGTSNWYEQRALAYAEQGERAPLMALECGKLGRAYVTAGILSGTQACYREAIRLDPRYMWPFNNLSWQLATWSRVKLRDGAEAVRLATTACEQSGWRCWGFLDTLAAAYASVGRFQEAVQTAEKALALAPADQQAGIRYQIGQYSAGRPWQQPATSPEIDLQDEEHVAPVGPVAAESGRAAQLLAAGRYEEAETAVRQELAEAEDQLGSTHPALSVSLRQLGLAYLELGRADEAEAALKRAVLLAERSVGLSHPLTLAALDALAQFCFRHDRDLEASCLLRHLAEQQEKTVGRDSPQTAATLELLGRSLWAQSRLTESAEAMEQALTIRRALPESDPAAVAALMHYLGRLYFSLDRDEEAVQLYHEALGRLETTLGHDSVAVADVLCDLAELHRYHGRTEQATPLLQRALAIRESMLGPSHEHVTQLRARLETFA